ncbi:MAG: hypothetical protein CMC79_05740 [Flavobacteriaceae bacterium]|nr:hypothetical protein [Flavobacteriaceae bacterium]|tara:strand:- start:1768 stop:2058 length:291 start_codon:yes stop_codon:yes gene_type:complete
MYQNKRTKDFYSRFLENLKFSQSWPGPYMFKFILKGNDIQTNRLKLLFLDMNPVFSIKKSSNNRFLSLSIKVTMNSPEEVITIYKQVSKFKGVITL